VAKLDVPVTGANKTGNIWVVYLKNADAAKLATVLRAAFGGGGGGARGARLDDARPRRLRRSRPAGPCRAGSSPRPTRRSRSRPARRPAASCRPTRHQLADHHGARADVPAVRAMIDQLDSRRAQVYIESHDRRVSAATRGRASASSGRPDRQAGDKTRRRRAPT
jgi:general secretion pathway protein D